MGQIIPSRGCKFISSAVVTETELYYGAFTMTLEQHFPTILVETTVLSSLITVIYAEMYVLIPQWQ
jgi:hypothetical protein